MSIFVQTTDETRSRKCVTLAIRPLVLGILKKRLHPLQRSEASHRQVTESVRALLETSSCSAMKSIRILTVLLDQDLLGKTVQSHNFRPLLNLYV
jgi:hypothetical protein